MEKRLRQRPEFAVCGLNCGLCPRYHADGVSRCPGCEGPGFYEKHPTCGVISCSKRHGDVEFCYECSAYPCERFAREGEKDSFISYRNVVSDFEAARSGGLDAYMASLHRKMAILEYLLANVNDGRKKSLYCTAVNLLPLADLEDVVADIRQAVADPALDQKARAARAAGVLNDRAEARGIPLALRK